MWVYRKDEEFGIFLVGYYDPSGNWFTDSTYKDRDKAAERVRYLNGGSQRSHEVE